MAGDGILTDRQTANQEMANAIGQNAGSPCCNNPTQGGVTGGQPATGPAGSRVRPRQGMLHPRPPSSLIGQQTGDQPCQSNNARSLAQRGVNGGQNQIRPITDADTTTGPVSPYVQNPLELPSRAPGGAPAFDLGGGQAPSPAASGQPSDCPPCNCDNGSAPFYPPAPDYAGGSRYAAGGPFRGRGGVRGRISRVAHFDG